MNKLYFLVFILYALISLAALLIHLQDNYWINALTIKAMFSNSFLTPYSVEFRWLENEFPIIISLISYIGFLGQSLFQFFMIPLIFTKWGSFFTKWWGMQFFIISLLAINLSYLPHMEIIVWLIILFPIKLNKNNYYSNNKQKIIIKTLLF